MVLVFGIGSNAAKPRVYGLLLHNRKLQNTELHLLYERKALPRSCLCGFLSTLLLESNAGIGFSHLWQCEEYDYSTLISFALYFL